MAATVCRKLSHGVDVEARRSLIHSQNGAVLGPADPIKACKQHLSAYGVSEFYRKDVFNERKLI